MEKEMQTDKRQIQPNMINHVVGEKVRKADAAFKDQMREIDANYKLVKSIEKYEKAVSKGNGNYDRPSSKHVDPLIAVLNK